MIVPMSEVTNREISIRKAEPRDVPGIVQLVKDLAEYEKAPAEAVKITDEKLESQLFAEHPTIFAHVVDNEEGTGLDGFALWFLNYSTWECSNGIYLEDLYVRPEARGKGIGKALLQFLARHAVECGYARMEWVVLKWNTPSIEFYKAAGAFPLEEWDTFRLTGDKLEAFAQN